MRTRLLKRGNSVVLLPLLLLASLCLPACSQNRKSDPQPESIVTRVLPPAHLMKAVPEPVLAQSQKGSD